MADWISEAEAERNESDANRQTEQSLALLASRMILADGPKFAEAVFSQLRSTANRLQQSESLAINATASDVNTSIEKGLQVAVSTRNAPFPRQTHTSVFYKNGSDRIRCIPLDSNPFTFFFVVEDGNLRAKASDSHDIIGPDEVAKRIVQPMVKRIQSPQINARVTYY